MSERIKILIVEDESIVAVDIRNILQKKLGYEVCGIIRSGEEAIEASKNLSPDLIIMDIVLDGKLTGIEAAARIKSKFNIPFIYLTAFSDNETLAQAKLTEPYGYVLKPLDEKVLLSVIEMALYKAKAEKIIVENQEKYKRLIENSPAAIGVHCEGIIVYVNPAAVRLFGASYAKDIIGNPVSKFIQQSYRGIIDKKVKHLRTNGMSIEGIPEKLIKIDGTIIDIETSAMPTKFNEKPAIEVIITDITEAKKQNRVRESLLKILQILNLNTSSEEFFSIVYGAVKEFIPVELFLISLFSKVDNHLTFLYLKDELDQKEILTRLVNHTIEKNETILLKLTEIEKLIKPDAPDNPILYWLGAPIDFDSESILVMGGGTRNTEIFFRQEDKDLFELFTISLSGTIIRKLKEKEQAKELAYIQELNITKEKFFSTLSHEIKNNFNSLLGYTDILKNDFDSLTPSEIKSSIDSLFSSSRSIYNLIEKLLRFSQFSTGSFKPHLRSISLHDLLGKEIKSIKNLAEKKNIKFSYSFDEDLKIFCDEEVVSTIMQNLIMQTVKYSQAGNRIEVKATEENDYIVMSVADDGTGIEEYLLKNLFISKEKISGIDEENLGIGYHLTKEIIKKCGGNIHIENNPGVKSVFKLILPVSGKQQVFS